MFFDSWIIAFLLILFFSIYWYFSTTPGFWEGKDIISIPRRSGILGFLRLLFTKPLHEIIIEQYKTYGRLYGYYESQGKVGIVIGDPELIRNIVLKDFQYFMNPRDINSGDKIADNMLSALSGEKWKRMRSIISQTFSTGKIKNMTSIILDSAETLCENCKKAAETGTCVDMKSIFGAFSMDVIASSAFATKVDSHNDPNNKFVRAAKEMFGGKFRFILLVLFPKLARIFGVTLFSSSAMNFFREVVIKIIKERKRTGNVRNDFLQFLMDASELGADSSSSIDIEEQEENSLGFKLSGKQKKLSQDELLAQCVVFFLAGYETTSTVLSLATYLLALNTECQEKLIQEIDKTLADYKGEITYECVQNMNYLDYVIAETLRIYPPSPTFQRESNKEYTLPGTDIELPKGSVVMVPVYAMHYDPEFFPDPEKFDPERFTPKAKSSQIPYTYLPFGAGPRQCIGMRFALMEMKLCLAKLLSQFRVKKCPETKVPLEFRLAKVLLNPKEILLAMEKRPDISL